MTAAQNYVIKDIKKAGTWTGAYGDFQAYGLAVKGIGEPVKLNLSILAEEPKVGESIYGTMRQEKAKDGRSYWLLQPEKKADGDKRTEDIHAQVAVKLAVEVWLGQGADKEAYDNIETEAKHFFNMIERVKQ